VGEAIAYVVVTHLCAGATTLGSLRTVATTTTTTVVAVITTMSMKMR